MPILVVPGIQSGKSVELCIITDAYPFALFYVIRPATDGRLERFRPVLSRLKAIAVSPEH
ncbi:hypothetical protein ACFQ5D_18825 [Paenibacillus farraposensis]|uniref:Uncharacterized protein n=1 Tax=Paenibacillus farraposensis TaxID=2807095 RepID=A0ABW4DHV4_9BACL